MAVHLPVAGMLHHTAVRPLLPGVAVVATEADHVNGIVASSWPRELHSHRRWGRI